MKRFNTLLLSILFFFCKTPIKNDTIDTGLIRFQNYNQEITILPDDIINLISEGIYPNSCFLHLIKIFSSKREETTIVMTLN